MVKYQKHGSVTVSNLSAIEGLEKRIENYKERVMWLTLPDTFQTLCRSDLAGKVPYLLSLLQVQQK